MTQEQSGEQQAAVSAVGQEQPSPAEQAIAADIERTRAELGETVQQLADKAHVGARAKHAAADMRGRAVHAARDLRDRGTHAAAEVGGKAKQQAAKGRAQLGSQLSQAADAIPDPVSDRARAMPGTARRYWAQLAAAAAALTLAVLAVRKLRK